MQLHIIKNDSCILLLERRLSLSWTEASVRSTCPRSNVQKDVGQRDRWVSSTSSPFGALRPSQGWSLCHLWLITKCNNKTKQRQPVNYLPLFSTVSTLLPCQQIHPLGHSRCKTEWMPQFATASSHFFLRLRSLPCDTQATLSTRPFENICSYSKAKN